MGVAFQNEYQFPGAATGVGEFMTAVAQLCFGCMRETGGAQPCPQCGFEDSGTRAPSLLPLGTILNGKFYLGKVLGEPGGYGITYLAWDMTLHTRVAIKEFFPRQAAGRDPNTLLVVPHTNSDRAAFAEGLTVFLAEARTLARFDHPNVVRVREFFTEHDTGYFVMNYYDGQSLPEFMTSGPRPMSPATVFSLLMPILDGLEAVHAQSFAHRDIKPSNIYIRDGGSPVLLDFGAARLAVGEKTTTLSVVLTPGFAPVEQYHSKGKQGPWTDIYALGGTLYYMMTGKVPPDALDRSFGTEMASPNTVNEAVSDQLNQAIVGAMTVQAERRPQNVGEFRALLLGEVLGEDGPPTVSGFDVTESYDPDGETEPNPNHPDIGALPTRNGDAGTLAGGDAAVATTAQQNTMEADTVGVPPQEPAVPMPSSSPPKPWRRWVLEVAVGVMVIVVLADVGFGWFKSPDPIPAQTLRANDVQTQTGDVVERAPAVTERRDEVLSASQQQPPPRPEAGGTTPLPRPGAAEGQQRRREPGFGPPPDAFESCTGVAANAACEFQAPHGKISGICRTMPDGFVCVPRNRP
jgi:serine/threonine protein kinase